MRVIIGYGNKLRGEDGFGVDVIDELQNHILKDTTLIKVFQLTPELVLELLDADEIIFIDACFSYENNYKLACSLIEQKSNLSHHISPKLLIALLKSTYNLTLNYYIYSMLTNNFDEVIDESLYKNAIENIYMHLLSE